MNEREFEIILSRNIEHFLGKGWQVLAHQLTLSVGRIDLMLVDPLGVRCIAELKKGSPSLDVIIQVMGYVESIKSESGVNAIGVIIANSISDELRYAATLKGIRVIAIKESELFDFIKSSGMDESLLLGPRKKYDVIFGGESRQGLWGKINEEDALDELPSKEYLDFLNNLKLNKYIRISHGKLQTVIKYRGVKMGGINRREKHFYISNGIVINDDYKCRLIAAGFVLTVKCQVGSRHEHIYYKAKLTEIIGAEKSFSFGIDLIDSILGHF